MVAVIGSGWPRDGVGVMNARLLLGLYDPCDPQSPVEPLYQVDDTPVGRRFCLELIRDFNEQSLEDTDIDCNLGVFMVPSVRRHAQQTAETS